MFNKKWYVTKSIWIEAVDYYNAGLTFDEMREHLAKKFYGFGDPTGASTSLVIELYANPSAERTEEIAYEIYDALNELLWEKKLVIEN